MDKLVMKAFEKLQKQEHFLRMVRDRLERGLITQEEFEKEKADIYEAYQLTPQENRAYREYIKMIQRRKR